MCSPKTAELAAVRQWTVKAALGSPPEPAQPSPLPPPPLPQGLLLERQPEATPCVIDADLLTRALARLVMGFVLLCGAAFQGRRHAPSRA